MSCKCAVRLLFADYSRKQPCLLYNYCANNSINHANNLINAYINRVNDVINHISDVRNEVIGGRMIHYYGRNGVDANIDPQNPMDYLGTQKKTAKPRI